MRSTLSALALISIALFGAGCKKGPTVVGKWNGQQGPATIDLEFKPDNTFSMATKAGQFGLTIKGDYKLEGEKLALTFKDVDAPGLPAAAVQKAKASPDFGKPHDATIKFVSDDEITFAGTTTGSTAQAQTIDLKRVKG